MNLAATIELFFGGPGSGCDPSAAKKKGNKCGRPKKYKKKPKTFYHGTTVGFLPDILKKGLVGVKRGKYENIYLTRDESMARSIAEARPDWVDPSRRGKPGVVLAIRPGSSLMKWSDKHPEDVTDRGFTVMRRGEFQTVVSGQPVPPNMIDLDLSYIVYPDGRRVGLRKWISLKDRKKKKRSR